MRFVILCSDKLLFHHNMVAQKAKIVDNKTKLNQA